MYNIECLHLLWIPVHTVEVQRMGLVWVNGFELLHLPERSPYRPDMQL